MRTSFFFVGGVPLVLPSLKDLLGLPGPGSGWLTWFILDRCSWRTGMFPPSPHILSILHPSTLPPSSLPYPPPSSSLPPTALPFPFLSLFTVNFHLHSPAHRSSPPPSLPPSFIPPSLFLSLSSSLFSPSPPPLPPSPPASFPLLSHLLL